MNALDNLLRGSDPARMVEDAWTDELAAEVVVGQRTRIPRRGRMWRTMPFILIGAAVLTGGALVAVAALGQLGANGKSVDYDVTVPIRYTDTRGVFHQCTYGFYVGDGESKSPGSLEIVDWLKSHDWSEAGQWTYNYAQELQADGIEGPTDYQHKAAFSRALNTVLYQDIPTQLLSGSDVLAGTSDCDGQGLTW